MKIIICNHNIIVIRHHFYQKLMLKIIHFSSKTTVFSPHENHIFNLLSRIQIPSISNRIEKMHNQFL